jgi:hypothetical protein
VAIVIPIVTEFNPQGLKRATADISKAEGGWKKTGKAFESAFLPASVALGGLVAVGAKFITAAADDAKAAAGLANTLRNVTGATDASIASTEEWISAQGRALGVADDDLRPALATLATATGDVAKAQDLAALAMDLSAAKGIDLKAASDAIAKAYTGNTTALGKMVPGIDKAALASKDFTAVSESLAGIVGGAAATAADTQAGKMDRVRLSMAETGEAIGGILLPALDAFLPLAMAATDWASENAGLVTGVAVAVGALAGAIVAVNLAMKAWAAISAIVTAAQWLWNVALTANPIGALIMAVVAVIAVVAALVAAIVLAYKKVDWFRNAVDKAFAFIKAAAKAFATAFMAVWNGIWAVVEKVVGWITDAINSLSRLISGIMDGIKGVISHIPGLSAASANVAATTSAGVTPYAGASSAPAAGPTFAISGAIDPEATARQIRAILTGQDTRQGRAYGTPRRVAW